jgi:protein associated with RNAse G/E
LQDAPVTPESLAGRSDLGLIQAILQTILQASNPNIEVRACKYNGLLHRTWRAELIRKEESLLILDAEFDVDIEHDFLGTIVAGTSSLEYYWLDRWYSVFRFGLPGGELRSYYCNVNVPPTFDGRVLSYIDLDIDILVEPNLTYQILDLDEFEKNSALYHYSNEVRRNSRQAVVDLVRLIEMKQFPFDA